MKESLEVPSAAEVAMEVQDETREFNEVHLRLLLKEHDEVSARLIDLDFRIWVLEESLRSGGP